MPRNRRGFDQPGNADNEDNDFNDHDLTMMIYMKILTSAYDLSVERMTTSIGDVWFATQIPS